VTIRFGVSPIAWANDDMPELGGDTELETILSEIQELGFEGVELGGKFPREAGVLKSLLSRFGLDLVGGWYSTNLLVQSAEQEIAALQAHLSLLKALGSEVFVMAETSNAVHGKKSVSLEKTPLLEESEWAEFGGRLTEVSEYIAAQGLRVAYHHHLGTVVDGAEQLDRFLTHTGDVVGLTLDTGHAVLGGIDPLSVIERVPERITHVHCKDVRLDVFKGAVQRGASFLDGVVDGMFTVPGDGSIDYRAVMMALKNIDYSGWIILEAEQDPAIANPKTYAELGLRTLKMHAETEGLLP